MKENLQQICICGDEGYKWQEDGKYSGRVSMYHYKDLFALVQKNQRKVSVWRKFKRFLKKEKFVLPEL